MEMHKLRMTGIPIASVAFKMAIAVGDCWLQITKRDVHVTHEFTRQDLVYPTSLHFSPCLSLPVVFKSVMSYIVLWTFLNQLDIVIIAGKGQQWPQFLPLSSLALFALPLLCVSSWARDTVTLSNSDYVNSRYNKRCLKVRTVRRSNS